MGVIFTIGIAKCSYLNQSSKAEIYLNLLFLKTKILRRYIFNSLVNLYFHNKFIKCFIITNVVTLY